MLGPAAGPLVAICGGMLKALGTLAGWVLMTAQVSRAAADHGLLPQMFARTRAGDTPVAGLIVAGLLGTVGHRAHHRADAGQAVRPAGGGVDVVRAAHLPGRVRGRVAVPRARANWRWRSIGGAFCVFVIAWSSVPVLIATVICMVDVRVAAICRCRAGATCCRIPRCAPANSRSCASGTTIRI